MNGWGLLGVEDRFSSQPLTVTFWVHHQSEVRQPNALSHGGLLLVFVRSPECTKFCFSNLRSVFLRFLFIIVGIDVVVLHLSWVCFH